TQQPNRLVPQLGVVVSTTRGHSPPSEAPWYMPRSDLLSWPQGFLTCIRYSQTSSLLQSSIGLYTSELGRLTVGLSRSRTRRASCFVIVAARFWLSALRVPRTRMASPFCRTTSRTNLFEGRIFRRSVHQRNFWRGAG